MSPDNLQGQRAASSDLIAVASTFQTVLPHAKGDIICVLLNRTDDSIVLPPDVVRVGSVGRRVVVQERVLALWRVARVGEGRCPLEDEVGGRTRRRPTWRADGDGEVGRVVEGWEGPGEGERDARAKVG